MTTPRHGLPFIWPTWIAGLLSGDKQCIWAAWYRAHFKYAKRPDATFDSAAWTADHNALVQRRKAELEVDGWRVTLEGQNDFKLSGQKALLSGKPDLIAIRSTGALVSDAKTGRQRNADYWQVLVYMLALPRRRADLVGLRGEVCYPDHIVPIEPEELTSDRQEQIFAMLRLVGGDERPQRVPSQFECSFCDVADCPDRWAEAEQPEQAAATEF